MSRLRTSDAEFMKIIDSMSAVQEVMCPASQYESLLMMVLRYTNHWRLQLVRCSTTSARRLLHRPQMFCNDMSCITFVYLYRPLSASYHPLKAFALSTRVDARKL